MILYKSGGCDGCIDKDKPANAGLEPFVKALEPTFKRYENILTRCHQTRIVDSSHQQNVEIWKHLDIQGRLLGVDLNICSEINSQSLEDTQVGYTSH